MPINRFFIATPLSGEITIEDSEFHHLANATRTRVGERVEVINGQGQLALAKVVSISKKHALLSIEEITKEEPRKRQVILAQAIPRINRLDWIVEKGTELGMSSLWLFPGEASERQHLTEHQRDRLTGLTIAATKQCGRLWLPDIQWMPPLAEWEKNPYRGFFGDISPNAPLLSDVLRQVPPQENLVFFVGPESGFTPNEIAFLQSNHHTGVSLNANILRTDTAAVAALALILGM